MSTLPEPVEQLLDAALVGELTVVDATGHPVTYPLIPLYDGEKIYLTSSTLFSRKLEHIKGNPKVSLSITDPIAVGGRADRVDDPGRRPGDRGGPARRLGAAPPDLGEEGTVDRVLPEGPRGPPPVLRTVADRDHAAAGLLLGGRRRRDGAGRQRRREGGRVMAATRPASTATPRPRPSTSARASTSSRAIRSPILTFVDDAGYPVSVAIAAAIDPAAGSATFAAPAGLTVPSDVDISLTGSHIRPQPGYGYDERRHVTVWGRADVGGRRDGRLAFTAPRAWGWDEAEVPFFEYSERSTGQSKKYFDALSVERGTPVKPKLSFGWLALRTTRLPFLSATIVPVVLGIVIAARQGSFDLLTAVLTVIGAAFVQLGLNVANDVFDTIQGADDANVTPTQFSGGSRVIQYGLVSLRQMAGLSTVFYVLAGVIGLVLLALRGSPALLVIGVVGFIVCLGYTAPPLKFVYRGLGEIAVAVGFGPLMLLGGVCGPDPRRPVVGAIRRLAPGRPARRADPVRQRDPRSARRRAGRQADAAGSLLKPTVIAGYRAAAVAAYVIVVAGRGRRPPADPCAARPPHDPAGPPGVTRPRAELRQPVRADGDHGRQREGPPVRRAAPARRLRGRPDPGRGGPVGEPLRRPIGGPGPERRSSWAPSPLAVVSQVAAVDEDARRPDRGPAPALGAADQHAVCRVEIRKSRSGHSGGRNVSMKRCGRILWSVDEVAFGRGVRRSGFGSG